LNDSDGAPASGFTRYVTIEQWKDYCENNDKDHDHLSDALWGSQRTNGIVKDIHDLKMWIKFLGILGGLITPIITAIIIKFFVGA